MDNFVSIGVPLIAAAIDPVLTVLLSYWLGMKPTNQEGRSLKLLSRPGLSLIIVVALLFGAVAWGLLALGENSADGGNRDPVAHGISVSLGSVDLCEQVTILLDASDPDGDLLTVRWTALYGVTDRFFPSVRKDATYTAPAVWTGDDLITAYVDDGHGGRTDIKRPIQIVVSTTPIDTGCPEPE